MAFFRRSFSTRRASPIGIAIGGGIVGIILIGVGIFSMFRGSELETLAQNGERIEGQVIDSDKEERRETYRRNGRRRTRTKTYYYLTCSFEDNGRKVSDRIEVSSSVYGKYSRASATSPVPATYVVNPGDHSDWMLLDDLQAEKSSSGLMAWLMPLVGLLVLAGAGVGAFFAHKKKQAMGGQIPQQSYAPPPGQAPQKYPQQPGQAPPPNQGNVLYDENQPENKHQPPPWQS